MARKSRKNIAEPISAALYIRTALYVRLSVEDINGRGNSIENQILILNEYISDKPEFKVYDTYIDNGLSGLDFDRPAFQRMLKDIENGNVNCVIVKDISRLGRNIIDTGYYVEQYFVQHKIRFIAVNDNFDSAHKSAASELEISVKNIINEAYALDIGRKIKSVKHRQILNGEYIGARAPFGYSKDPNDRHKLIINEEEAPIVRQIFEWFVSGVGKNAIAIRLNEMGVKPSSQCRSETTESGKNYRKSEYWHSLTINAILKNEIYTGDMVQGKTKMVDHKRQVTDENEYIVVRNTHEPIVSRELFEKARQIKADNNEKIQNQHHVSYTENIFRCRMICQHCGRPLIRQRNAKKSGKEYYYFSCASKYRVSKDICPGVRINEETLKQAVCEALIPEISALGNLAVKADFQKSEEDIKKQKAEKQRKLNNAQSFLRSLYENYVSDILSDEEYKELKSDYENQSTKLREDIESLCEEARKLNEQREKADSLKDIAKTFKKNKKLTSDMVKRFIEEITISHEHEIAVKFLSDKESRKECS